MRVADGDTVTVELDNGKRERIRFGGIDAPESSQTYGRESRKNLIDLLEKYGSCVIVEYDRRDNYGRIVGKVISGGVDLNLEQVKSGSAWVYRNYLKNLSLADKARYVAPKFQPEIAMQDFGLILIRPLRGYTVETTDRFVPFKESNGKALLPTSPLNFYSSSKFWRQSAFSSRAKT